jgi:hypothetical protein
MNVDIGAEATQFPEKEYINGIAVAVYTINQWNLIAACDCLYKHNTALPVKILIVELNMNRGKIAVW